jgi:hypothetical protein
MKREFFMQRETACGETKSTAQSQPQRLKPAISLQQARQD